MPNLLVLKHQLSFQTVNRHLLIVKQLIVVQLLFIPNLLQIVQIVSEILDLELLFELVLFKEQTLLLQLVELDSFQLEILLQLLDLDV